MIHTETTKPSRQYPRSVTEAQLKKVKVTLVDPDRITLSCNSCGRVWQPMLKTGGRLARGYWKCPFHRCNAEG